METQQFLVGRQPIFDAMLDVYGYELLFRGADGLPADDERMTAEVLVHAGLDIGLDGLVGSKRAFVNAPRSFLVGELPISLPPEQTVIEVLETVAHDAAVLEGCRRLVADGYQLALDDYVYSEGDAPLLELASFVKLDVLGVPADELARQVARCSGFGARLLAEKVEAPEQMAMCEKLGFELFQGYLLSRPRTVAGRTLSPAQLTCVRLVEQLHDPEVSAQDLADLIETDPGLSYRFLHAAPVHAEGGLHRKLSSIREGVVLLGTRRLRDWVSLMMLAGTHVGPIESIAIAMIRARMSELLALADAPDLQSAAFTVGLVSAFDLVLGVSLEEIVSHLVITDELRDALLERSGLLGEILEDVVAWEVADSRCHSVREPALLAMSYVEALAWANDVCKALEPALNASSAPPPRAPVRSAHG